MNRTRTRLRAAQSTRLVPFGARVAWIGDSIFANALMRSIRQWTMGRLSGRLVPGPGLNLAVGGTTMPQIYATLPQALAQGVDLVFFNGGTNDLNTLNAVSTQNSLDAFDNIVADCRAAGVKMVTITVPPTTGYPDQEAKRAAINAHRLSAATASDLIVVDVESIDTGADLYDGTHPDGGGAYRIATMILDAIDSLIGAGDIRFTSAADATARGNLLTSWDFLGTSGTFSGTITPTGTLPTNWTLLNSTSCAVTATPLGPDGGATDPGDEWRQLQIDIVGVASADATIRLRRTRTGLSSVDPGEYMLSWVGCRAHLPSDDTAAPTGIKAIAAGFGGGYTRWGTSAADANVGLLEQAINLVLMGEPSQLSTQPFTANNFDIFVQVATGAVNARIILDRPGLVPWETTAYAVPSLITTQSTAPNISGIGTVGQVLTAFAGRWAGGGLTISYQWERGGVPIAGATSRTYTLVGADAGTTVTCVITASNGLGSASTEPTGIAVA